MNFYKKIKAKVKRITPITLLYKYYKRIVAGYLIYKRLIKKYGNRCWFLVVPWPGTGDAFQTGRYLEAYLDKNGIEEYVLLVGNDGVKRVLSLFSIQAIKVLCFDDTEHLSHLLQFVGEQHIHLRILHHNPPEMYSSMMKTIEGIHGYTWGEMFYSVGLGLSDGIKCSQPNFSTDTSLVKEYFLKNNLKKGKTVIISPYANTFINMSSETWIHLATCLKQLGYDVCTNSSGDSEPVIYGTKPIFFSYKDAVSVLEYAGYFIGVRSGLCDIVSSAKCKKIVLYQPATCGFGPVIDLFNMNRMGLCSDAVEFEFYPENELQNITNVLSCFAEAQTLVERIKHMNCNKKYKVSVIIPAYNAEKYLFECLKSVQAQKMNDMEILVVDNGSNDGTGTIIDEFCSFDTRFKKIKISPNIGVANARNEALKVAEGEYVVFSDADDYVPPRAYSAMYKRAISDAADVVVGHYYEIVDDIYKNFNDIDASGKPFVTYFYGGVVWNKMYRIDFLRDHNIFFQNYNFGEDTLFLGDILIHSPHVIVEEEDVYHHLQRNGSGSTVQLTRQYNAKNLRDYFKCGQKVYTLPYLYDEDEIYIEFMRYLDYVHHFWWENPDVKEQKETFPELQEFSRLFIYNSPEREADFIRIFKIKPSLFHKITYDVYLSFLVSYSVMAEVSPPYATPMIEPRVALIEEYQNGQIGFRYIIKYFRAWLSYKIRRRR